MIATRPPDRATARRILRLVRRFSAPLDESRRVVQFAARKTIRSIPAPAGREEAYQALRMDHSAALQNQIVGFTRQSMQQIGQARIRQVVASLGYPDRAIKLGDPALLQGYATYAHNQYVDIVNTFNRMLGNQLKALPVGISPAEARTALDPWFQGVRQYNKDVLIPRASRNAREEAQRAFYQHNVSPATGRSLADSVLWDWIQNTDYIDECARAAEASPAPFDALMQITGGRIPGVHYGCQCDLAARDLAPEDIPDPTDLWTGESDQPSEEAA